MFKFNSLTPELPVNSPPEFNNIPNTPTNKNSTPTIHINNLTVNVTPSQVVNCLQELVKPKTYNHLPKTDWYDETNDVNYYNNCNARVMPNKKLMLNIKKSNKPSPLDIYRNKN